LRHVDENSLRYLNPLRDLFVTLQLGEISSVEIFRYLQSLASSLELANEPGHALN